MRIFGKSSFLVFCLFLFLVLGLRGDTEKIKITITVAKANVRLNPSLESPVIGAAAQGEIFESQGKTDGWFMVNLPPDKKGTVLSGYIHSSIVEVLPEETKGEAEIKKVTTAPSEPPAMISSSRASPDEPAPSGGGGGFAVNILGGTSYFILGDLNNSFDGDRQSVNDNATPGSVRGSIKDLHYGMDIGVSLAVYPVRRLGVEVGLETLSATRKNEINWMDALFGEVEGIRKFEVSAIPLTIGICYDVPLGSKFSLGLHAGGAYYLARFKETSAYLTPAEDSDVKVDMSKGCFGFYGGVDFRLRLSPALSLFLTARGRYARLSKVEGDFSYAGISWYDGPFSIEGKRTLYYYKSWGKYPTLVWEETMPSGSYAIDARKAVIDLSGMFFGAGIQIRFGRR
jgi:hypothetical protein